MDIDSHLLEDIYKSDKDKDLFRKYYVVPDLFAYREMIDVLKMYDETRDTPEHKALINLYLYMMNKMATDPWWFSRLGHYNRFMGSRMRDESYIALRFNLAFTPNKFYNVHTMTELEKLNVNKETRRIEEVYGWVDPEDDGEDVEGADNAGSDTTSEAVSFDEIGGRDVETTDGN